MHEQERCLDEAANHQLPIAVAFWIIPIVSTEECSRLMQNLMQICRSTCSVILNVTATQYTCSLNGIYHPHWLLQWSHHCSHMNIPVHSPWLPGYIDVTQTVLIVWAMSGIFPDKPSIPKELCLAIPLPFILSRNIYCFCWARNCSESFEMELG